MRTVRINSATGTGLDDILWESVEGTETDIASLSVLQGFDFTDDTINLGDTIELENGENTESSILISAARIDTSADSSIYVKVSPADTTKLGTGTYSVGCGVKEVGTIPYDTDFGDFSKASSGGGGGDSTTPGDTEIWYTTSNGEAISVLTEAMFDGGEYLGPTLVSNTAPKDNNGKGILKFSSTITALGVCDTEFTQNYPIIASADIDSALTKITLPASVTYLGYMAIAYVWGTLSIAIPDTVTELWAYPNYKDGHSASCPFYYSRTYDDNTGEVTGGLEKVITSKGEFEWVEDADSNMYDYMPVTLANGNQYYIYDLIGL